MALPDHFREHPGVSPIHWLAGTRAPWQHTQNSHGKPLSLPELWSESQSLQEGPATIRTQWRACLCPGPSKACGRDDSCTVQLGSQLALCTRGIQGINQQWVTMKMFLKNATLLLTCTTQLGLQWLLLHGACTDTFGHYCINYTV